MRSRIMPALFGALLMATVACSPSDEAGRTDGVASTAEEADGVASTAVGADVAPSGLPLVEGLAVINVLGPPESGAGEVPLFRWEPVAGASRYLVAVLGPDGPLWGWQGEETEIYLGGLPFERPPGIAGPVIVAGTCWSVMVRDDEGHVMAVSEFLPVSPAESTGHTCVPGTGAEGG